MSSPDPARRLPRRATLAGLAVLGLTAACGFTPAYAPGGPAAALRGRVIPRAPVTPDEFAFAEAIRRRFGPETGAAHTLDYTLSLATVEQATAPDDTAIRTAIAGTVEYRLTEAGSGRVLAQGRTSATTSWDLQGTPVSSLSGEVAARERLGQILANQTGTLLVAALADAG